MRSLHARIGQANCGLLVSILEIVAGLVVAIVAFAVLKIVGLLIKFAAVAAIFGFIAGFAIVRAFRRNSG